MKKLLFTLSIICAFTAIVCLAGIFMDSDSIFMNDLQYFISGVSSCALGVLCLEGSSKL
tara:strand:+ start:912 stop:1088 length:177 start_codon:yes stop_codon:yes gene_type:complete